MFDEGRQIGKNFGFGLWTFKFGQRMYNFKHDSL